MKKNPLGYFMGACFLIGLIVGAVSEGVQPYYTVGYTLFIVGLIGNLLEWYYKK